MAFILKRKCTGKHRQDRQPWRLWFQKQGVRTLSFRGIQIQVLAIFLLIAFKCINPELFGNELWRKNGDILLRWKSFISDLPDVKEALVSFSSFLAAGITIGAVRNLSIHKHPWALSLLLMDVCKCIYTYIFWTISEQMLKLSPLKNMI